MQIPFVAFQVLSLDGCRQSTSRSRAREVVRTAWRAPSGTADGRRGSRLGVSDRQPPEVHLRWVISNRKAFAASMQRLHRLRNRRNCAARRARTTERSSASSSPASNSCACLAKGNCAAILFIAAQFCTLTRTRQNPVKP